MNKRSRTDLEIFDIDGNVVHRAYVDDVAQGLRGADLGGIIAPYGQLQGLDLTGANLYWATLRSADLSHSILDGCDLRGAILEKARCRSTSFRNADLGLDNLGGATDLRGADLSAAKLSGAKLAGALYDQNTLFPTDFSPVSAGMISVAESSQ